MVAIPVRNFARPRIIQRLLVGIFLTRVSAQIEDE
jgi:hypothetical protein